MHFILKIIIKNFYSEILIKTSINEINAAEEI